MIPKKSIYLSSVFWDLSKKSSVKLGQIIWKYLRRMSKKLIHIVDYNAKVKISFEIKGLKKVKSNAFDSHDLRALPFMP